MSQPISAAMHVRICIVPILQALTRCRYPVDIE